MIANWLQHNITESHAEHARRYLVANGVPQQTAHAVATWYHNPGVLRSAGMSDALPVIVKALWRARDSLLSHRNQAAILVAIAEIAIEAEPPPIVDYSYAVAIHSSLRLALVASDDELIMILLFYWKQNEARPLRGRDAQRKLLTFALSIEMASRTARSAMGEIEQQGLKQIVTEDAEMHRLLFTMDTLVHSDAYYQSIISKDIDQDGHINQLIRLVLLYFQETRPNGGIAEIP